MTICNTAGMPVFTARPPQAYNLTTTFTGTGKSGFEFVLTSGEARVLNGTGGLETFYAATVNAFAPVPEPASVLLILGGLRG